MYPKISALVGPVKGESFTLAEESFSIGRQSSNQLSLRDTAVSRHHCLITATEGGHKLIDLESHNSTFINDVPVKERLLKHGDRIRIGDSFLVFLAHEGETLPALQELNLDDHQTLTLLSSVELRTEDAFYLHPQKIKDISPLAARLTEHFNSLIKIGTVVNSYAELKALERRMLELILDAIPAERGFILLLGPSSNEFSSIFGLNKQLVPEHQVKISQTLIRRVINDRVGILSNDIVEGGAHEGAESLISSGVQALITVPLILFDKVIGLIYLESHDLAIQFDEDHLQLLTAIAGICAGALENTRRIEWLKAEKERLVKEINLHQSMVGESAPMRQILQFISKVAPVESSVLILGESGTGKELVARAIHQNSRRTGQPFVAINCAALTDALLESELFGHERGAFTGAFIQKKGQLEVADGGTVFLDEIGELAAELQAKLLRVLQQREFTRVGGTRPIKINIRVIAATNRDLEKAMHESKFRQDLYFRLNVVSVRTPPLRERREDIQMLANYFAAKHGKACNRQVLGLSSAALKHLKNYDWPGNVRELENAIERAVVLGDAEYIMTEDLPESIVEAGAGSVEASANYFAAVKQTKKQLILGALDNAQGNITEAAKMLGMYPTYLHRLMRNLDLKSAQQKQSGGSHAAKASKGR